MDIKDQILDLEKSAVALEPDAAARAVLQQRVIRYTEKFLTQIYSLPAFRQDKSNGADLLNEPIREEGTPLEELIEIIRKDVDEPSLNPASHGHLGYIPGGGIYAASLADYMAAITNNYAGVYYPGPGAVRMENLLIRWAAQLVGYPENAGGNLASGGSIANLIAVVTARDAKNMKGQDISRGVIYASPHQHHSLNKAIRIAGLGENRIRYLNLDDRYRIDPDHLEQCILEDTAAGLKPWLVIASAGSTNTGAIDPLSAIGIIAEKHNLWYHIDAAYGAFFLLTGYGQKVLRGIALSDSVIMDPHKGLFLPYGTGIVLIKNRAAMAESHAYQASYMQDATMCDAEPSPADLSPELTKHFRGLRMWLPLKLHGLKPFKACLEEKLLLAAYAYRALADLPRFEVGPEPDLTVITFRVIPEAGNTDLFNQRLLEYVNRDGRVFISSTNLNGKYTLRLAILAFRTHLNTIRIFLKIVQEGQKKCSEAPEFKTITTSQGV